MGEGLLMEMDSLGNATAVNTWGPNGLASRWTPSGSVWYLYDERGCTVQRTNASGNVVDSYQTDAYGAVSPTPASTDPYIGLGAQQGYYRDPETGFQLCTYRYYDPAEGRWLTPDPIGMAGGINLYGYVGGNPVGWSDPSGLLTIAGDTSFPANIAWIAPGNWPSHVGLSKSAAMQLMIDTRDDAVGIWGHGSSGRIYVNATEWLSPEDIRLLARERARRGKRRFHAITVNECDVMQDETMVNALLSLSEHVRGYTGMTGYTMPRTWKRPAINRSGRSPEAVRPWPRRGGYWPVREH